MIRYLLILLATARIVLGAAGDITNREVRAEGWTADITIEGLNITGSYDFGWTSKIRGDTTSGVFTAGETVTQAGSGATAVAWGAADDSADIQGDFLWVYTVGITGTPNASGVWTGGTSGATFTPAFVPATQYRPDRSVPKVIFTVTSLGFNDTGNVTTTTRTVYGVQAMRKVYPDEADFEESFSGTHTTVRIILSDYIYLKDNTGAGNSGVAVTAAFLSGFYTKTGVPNNASPSTVCTNNSTIPYSVRKIVYNWSEPPFQLVTADFDLACVAFHHHGQNDRPVRVVKFTASDTHGHTVEDWITTPAYNVSTGDEMPVVEYRGTIDVSTLTQGDILTCNFVAYPWVGDSACIGDTSTGTPAPSGLVGPKTYLNDKLNAYGRTYALVDPTGSDAGANTVYDAAVFNPATAYKFATISEAASAIAVYNNTVHGRNDVGAGIIKLNAGSYSSMGSSNTYGTVPATWLMIEPNTGVARSDVLISGDTGDGDISDRVRFRNVTITATGNGTFASIGALWFDSCDFNTAGTTNFSGTGVQYHTRGLIRQLGQGLKNTTYPPALVRGCDLTGFNQQLVIYTVLGNKHWSNDTFDVADEFSGSTPRSVPILGFNSFKGLDGTGNVTVAFGKLSSNIYGAAIIQNEFENYTTASGGLASIGSADNTEHANYLIWHNSFVGQRCFVGYNDSGTLDYRRYFSQINNYFDRWANKGDTFPPQDAVRIGGWPVKFNVGSSGNYFGQIMQSLPGNFYAEFDGLSSFEWPENTYGTPTDAMFTDRQSAIGVGSNTIVAGAGQGDYTLEPSSPLIGLPMTNLIGYDLGGFVRGAGNNAAGAYAGPNDPTPPAPTSTINAGTTNATNIRIQ